MPDKFYGRAALLFLCLGGLAPGLGAQTYYVASTGSDGRSGTSPEKAWRTVPRVSDFKFKAGDKVYFEGGQTFKGTISVDAKDGGNAADPLVFGSFGSGRAIIDGGDVQAFKADDKAGIVIENLEFVGSGATNTEDGISFYCQLPGDAVLDHIRVRNCKVSGFGKRGISIGSWPESGYSGYRDISITGCVMTNNIGAGLGTWGRFSKERHHHQGLYVGHCQAFDNPGIEGRAEPTGSGIVVSSVDGALVEHCIAHHNGSKNEPTSGPAGIWAYNAKRVVLQFNEVYEMSCGTGGDGDGFDLDGGVTDSIVQYNYSHDNDGAGVLVCNYAGGLINDSNIVRFNISINDGRKNKFASYSLWGANADNLVTNAQFYNNLGVVSGASAPEASCAQTYDMNVRNISFRNNIFIAAGGRELFSSNKPMSTEIRFQGNDYWTPKGAFKIKVGTKTYKSLSQWRSATPGKFQETLDGDGRPLGGNVDPKLKSPFIAPTLNDTAQLAALEGFKLRPDSPMRDRGLDLKRLFGADAGTRDFFGSDLATAKAPDVGPHEWIAPPTK